jgi:hypothetical protein
VTTIERYAFYHVEGLINFTIPASVTTIGGNNFEACDNLLSITVDTNNSNYSSVDGVLFNKLQTSLIKYPTAKENDSYTIPDSVESISPSAFIGSSSLTSVTIPDSVTSIGEKAFVNCVSLTSVTIPDSVTTIEWEAFAYCNNLTSITIPDSVTSIGDFTFAYCNNLTSITIPDSVTSIGNQEFDGCTSLTTVTLPATLFMEENYSSYSLSADQVRVEKTSIDAFVANAETAARTAGQTDVTGDPATYSLFTAADVTGAETAARTLGQQDVVNAPSSFDLYTASDLVVPKFLNLSNRAYVGIGDEILIGSMMILDKPMRILVRVAGPSLANGADPVPNPLLDPTVQLVRLSDGATIKTNDNWEDDLEQKTLIESTGIPPSDSRESAMVTTVDPGTYSFVVRGVGDTTGFANLEIYEFAE